MNKLYFFACCLAPLFLSAQTPNPRLVWDVGIANDSLPIDGDRSVVLGNQVVFVHTDPFYGTELWVTTGNAASTHLLKDINPGSEGSFSGFLTVHDGWLYFGAAIPSTGLELWRTDGTSNGTHLVKDIFPGSGDGMQWPTNTPTIVSFRGKLVFQATDGVHGGQLWQTDGTEDGTTMLTNLVQSSPNNYPDNLAVLSDSVLLFSASRPIEGEELWKTDGSSTGTALVKDILFGAESSSPKIVAIGDGYVLFQTYYYYNNGSNAGTQLWRTDGTEDGTYKKQDFPESNAITPVGVLNGHCYFMALDNGAIRLWQTDGTGEAPFDIQQLVVNPINNISQYYNDFRLKRNNTLYFVLGASYNAEGQLWKTDGTITGSSIVAQITAKDLIAPADRLYIVTNNTVVSVDDPPNMPAVSFVFSDYRASDKHPFALVGNGLFYNFISLDPEKRDYFGKLNLPAGQSKPVFYPYESKLLDGNPNILSATGSRVFFNAIDPVSNQVRLYVADTVSGGNRQLPIVTNSPYNQIASNGNFLGGKVLLNVAHEWSWPYWSEIWTSDGTLANTQQLGGLPYAFKTSQFYPLHGKVYFNLSESTQNGLWRSDGTSTGLELVLAGDISNIVQIKDTLFFVKKNLVSGMHYDYDLWKTDGQNTALVKNAGYEDVGGPPNYPWFYQFILPINIGGHYGEISYGTGSNGATTTVEGYPTLPPMTDQVTASANSCFVLQKFDANHPDDGLRLYKCPVGGDFEWVGSVVGSPETLVSEMRTVHDNLLVRIGTNGQNGEQTLWLLDSAQTAPALMDINPNGDDHIGAFTLIADSMVVFSAFNGSQWAFWRSDGTLNGTYPLANFATTLPNPNIQGMFLNSHLLYFSANDGQTGQELWVLDLAQSGYVPTQTPVNALKNAFSLSPNPCSDKFFILPNNNRSSAIKTVEVLDASGRLVGRFVPNAERVVDVTGLAAGGYFVRVATVEGWGAVLWMVKI